MKMLVSGLVNLETTVQVEEFPISYTPVRYPFFGINQTVSGVGFNVAKALTILGDEVCLLAFVGKDPAGRLAREAIVSAGLPEKWLSESLDLTPQSVVLYDRNGQRMIHVDLKDIQSQGYPEDHFEAAIQECDLAVLGNINFSRPFLQRAKGMGKLVATDVHAVSSLEDEYNRDFMAAADVLFMSDEQLPCSPEDWVRRVWDCYPAEVVVVGLGAQGALLGVRQEGFLERLPAIRLRPVVNTIGAGDALFSCFMHSYAHSRDPYSALYRATVFAAFKIGENGAAEGFLDPSQLEQKVLELQHGPGLPSTSEMEGRDSKVL